MLALNKIRPGDVLLISSSSLSSKSIKTVTGGEYSHAAIFVSPKIIFEAVSDGLCFTALHTEYVGESKNTFEVVASYPDINPSSYKFDLSVQGRMKHIASVNSYRFLNTPRKPSTPKAIKVLRHKQIKDTPPNEITKRLLTKILPFWGLKYPELAKLLGAIPSLRENPSYREKAESVISSLAPFKYHDSYRGQYCSQLVLSVLEELDDNISFGIMNNDLSPSELQNLEQFEEISCFPSTKPNITDRSGELYLEFRSTDKLLRTKDSQRLPIVQFSGEDKKDANFIPNDNVLETLSFISTKEIMNFLSEKDYHPAAENEYIEFLNGTMAASYLINILTRLETEQTLWSSFLDCYEGENIFQDTLEEFRNHFGYSII
ncbi:hypothetical protein [Maridesulfovibrio sp.]|uniref:hypothetical protein n=1 Tax=unclassified Maridesulfovibrio TaxID=2794999 RepID=UPI003AFF7F1A